MRKVLKWIGIFLGGLIGLLLLAAIFVIISSNSRVNKTYDIQPTNFAIHNNDETLARGRHLVEIGCADCHGADLSGGTLIDEPPIASIFAGNLTAGEGGIGQSYTDADWVRAIRHGVTPGGKPLLIMPSQVYYYYSDEDVAAIVAYAKSVSKVDNILPQRSIGPLGRLLFTAGMLPAPAADRDQLARFKDRQMFLDGWACHVESIDDFADCHVLFRQKHQDVSPGRIGEGAKRPLDDVRLRMRIHFVTGRKSNFPS